MKYPLSTLIFLLMVTATTLSGQANPADTLEKVLEHNSKALGGDGNWAKISSMRVVLDIVEPEYTLKGTYLASRTSMRIDVAAGDLTVFAEGLHNGKAWQWSPDSGIQASNEKGAAALQNSINAPGRFYTLSQAAAQGVEMKLVPAEDSNEWCVRTIQKNGTVIDYYIDKNSGLNLREHSKRAFHPDIDPTEVTIQTIHSDPHWLDGVLRFRKQVNRRADTGEILGTTTVLEMEHNIEIPAGVFDAEDLQPDTEA